MMNCLANNACRLPEVHVLAGAASASAAANGMMPNGHHAAGTANGADMDVDVKMEVDDAAPSGEGYSSSTRQYPLHEIAVTC